MAACLAAALLAGCGVDQAKWTSPRSTVPAGSGLGGTTSGAPAPVGEVFAWENLRRVDPCGLMDDAALTPLGKPAESRLRDYSQCSNYMKDTQGKELNLTLSIGESTPVKPEGGKTVGGLPLAQSELDDHTACFVTAVTDDVANRGITVQSGASDPGDLCTPARKLLESAVDRVKRDAPKLDLAKNTLVDEDPCTLFSSTVLSTVVGDAPRQRASGLHTCVWNGDGVAFTLGFRLGTKPDDLADVAKTTPVNLGNGVTAQQKLENTSGVRCRVEWSHVSLPGDGERGEVVSLDFSRYDSKSGEDACDKTQVVAKALIPRLPKS